MWDFFQNLVLKEPSKLWFRSRTDKSQLRISNFLMVKIQKCKNKIGNKKDKTVSFYGHELIFAIWFASLFEPSLQTPKKFEKIRRLCLQNE